MLDENVLSVLNSIVDSIREAGLDPYNQLYGYVTTSNNLYITRHGDARRLIQTLDILDVARFINLLE